MIEKFCQRALQSASVTSQTDAAWATAAISYAGDNRARSTTSVCLNPLEKHMPSSTSPLKTTKGLKETDILSNWKRSSASIVSCQVFLQPWLRGFRHPAVRSSVSHVGGHGGCSLILQVHQPQTMGTYRVSRYPYLRCTAHPPRRPLLVVLADVDDGVPIGLHRVASKRWPQCNV